MKKTFFFLVLTFAAGALVGDLLFAETKTRVPLSIEACKRNCWHANEIAGLFASVLVQNAPGFIPNVLLETDKTIVFKDPRPMSGVQYIFIPKKDIKNIGDLTEDDKDYIVDLYSAIAMIINQQGIKNYRLWTNGPEKQEVTYLHFHLTAE